MGGTTRVRTGGPDTDGPLCDTDPKSVELEIYIYKKKQSQTKHNLYISIIIITPLNVIK